MVIFTDSQNAIKPLENVIEECAIKYKPNAIYLREKHLSDEEYIIMAKKIMAVCNRYNIPLFICHRVEIAKMIGVKNLHISANNLSKIGSKLCFDNISVAVHSQEDIGLAQKFGGTNLVYGHIFETACKPDLLPRGLELLKEICDKSTIPVIAIGGINKNNYAQVLSAGAKDFAIMSSAMKLEF